MNFYTILGLVFGILGILLMIALTVGAIWFIFWFVKNWNAGKRERQTAAAEQARRHGGQYVLEWNGPKAQGAPDAEFGELLVELPKRTGGGSARFYERGLSLDGKRIPYERLSDVFYDSGSDGKIGSVKDAIQHSAVLWLYLKRGRTQGIRDLFYHFDDQTMWAIQHGLGFQNQQS